MIDKVIITYIARKQVKILANSHSHSATLQGYSTEMHTFNVQESTTSIGKWMSWSGWKQVKNKISWVYATVLVKDSKLMKTAFQNDGASLCI